LDFLKIAGDSLDEYLNCKRTPVFAICPVAPNALSAQIDPYFCVVPTLKDFDSIK